MRIGIDRHVILPIFFVLFLFPGNSKQEKEAECAKGSQYWSKSFLNKKGTCVECPLYWENCYDQPKNDQERCVDSCRHDVKSALEVISISPTSSELRHSSTVSISVGISSLTSSSPPKLPSSNEQPLWLMLLLGGVLLLAILIITVFMVKKCRSRKKMTESEEILTLQRPIQATVSNLRLGGIQDTENEDMV
ncbi:uncharacterized protein LOC114517234 [Dendronephthya gigantea]|uniref:uncharacterized protein LOC114517234 n=1 Tax=Dendronephthya gigantea TaxID=151771 RepID=UPI00106D4AE5|nr:uncharacterized protein LOC114517234 [Dendronephthya gigantea]